MQKKFLAIALSGMMVFGSFAVAYAAGEQKSNITASVGAAVCGFSLDTDKLISIASGMGSKLGINLSAEDIAGLPGMLKNPEALEQTYGFLFTTGGIGAKVLDIVGRRNSMCGAVVNSLKNGEGGYDMVKIAHSLENAQEKNGSVVINGTEISKKEIYAALMEVLALFGGSQ